MPLEETLLQQLPKLGGKASSTNSKLNINVDQCTIKEPAYEYQEVDTYPFTSFVYKYPLVPEYASVTQRGSPDILKEEYHDNVHIGEQSSAESNDKLATKYTQSKDAYGDTSVTIHCKGHIASSSVNQNIIINSQGNLLASYKNANKIFSIPVRWLAKAGFQYCGIKDCVRCPRCGLKLKHWPKNADPLAEHHRLKPDCSFLLEHNQISDTSETDNFNITFSNYDTEIVYRTQFQQSHVIYRNPKYQDIDVREASFSRWPSCIVQTPRRLAEAGFFYTGIEDMVRCYACNGGLRKWDPEDDPWIEHEQWFSHCIHVIRERGHTHMDMMQTAYVVEEEEDVHHQIVKPARDCLLNNEHFTSVQYYLSEVDRIASFEHIHEDENESIRLDEAQISKMAREGLYATLSGKPVYVACSLCDTQFEMDSYNSNKNKHRMHCRFKNMKYYTQSH